MKKILLIAVLLVMTATTALAVPAKKMWRTVKQPDGTELKLMLIGDERLNYFITEDSVPVLENNNAYYYADGMGFGMKRSNTLAHNANQRTASEIKLAKAASINHVEVLRPITNQNLFRPTRRLAPRRAEGDTATTFYTSDHRYITGQHKSLLILTEFPNRKFADGHDSLYYDNMVNQVGYTNENGAIGSIHDYFTDQSKGQLDLTFDVVGPIEMDYNYSHYGSGGSFDYQTGDNSWEFAYEAITKVDSIYHLNWADYDWDGDGEVENLYITYAGYGQATGGSPSTLWPAQTSFDDYNGYAPYYGLPTYEINFNGIKINTFAYGNELYGSNGTTPMGMGVMTHEFSHCLGFPDLYNTDYSGATDLGNWSIMDQGSYAGPNGIGWVPTGYTAYEKWAAGWIDYKEFAFMNDTITGLKSTYNGGDAYVIYNDKLLEAKNPDALEYFLLENRTQNRWDTYLPAQGLEIMHVNYVRSAWENNSVNTPTGGNGHSNMVLVNANNSYRNESGNLWPNSRRDSITATSNPNLSFYNQQLDGTTAFPYSIVQMRWNSTDSTVSFIYNPVDTMMTPAPKVAADPIVATANASQTRYYKDSTTVSLSAPLGYIRYSLDNENWTDYTEPFTIKDDSITVYAYAWREAHDTSSVTQVLFIKQKKLEAPVITGDTVFIGSTQVTITGEGGRIYYAQGESTRHFRTYSRPITIRNSTVIKAYVRATNNAYINSDTVEVAFTRLEVCNAPTISVSGDSTSITILTDVNDGHIWYRTDSTADYTEYTQPIDITSVTDSISVWAYVTAEGKITSDTVKFTYVVPQKPTDGIHAIIANGMSGRISVYTVAGQPVATADRIDSIGLRPGLYIVRDESGKTRKITVK